MNLKVTPGAGPSVDKLPVEIVERKGKGHQDTLADKAAEELSVRLSEYYLETFDQVLYPLNATLLNQPLYNRIDML